MTTYLYHARLDYIFKRHVMETCANCQKTRREHAEDDCLFEASQFQKSQLTEFLEHVMQQGGAELTLTCGPYTLKQKVVIPSIEKFSDKVSTVFNTSGDATLEIRGAT